MALAYARVSGRPGIVETPSGAGTMYAAPAVTEADGSSVPLVMLNSDVPTTSEGREALTGMNVEAAFRPLTRWNAKVHRPDMLARMLRSAFRSACSGKSGAVQLGIPEDVLSAEAPGGIEHDLYAEEQCRQYPSFRCRPDGCLVDQAVSLICGARRPVIIAGGGIHLSRAWLELEVLARYAGLPVATTVTGIGALAECDLSLGVVGGNGGKSSVNEVVARADLVLCLGTRLSSTTTLGFSVMAPGAKVIQVDIDPSQLGNNVRLDLGLMADLKLALADLRDALGDSRSEIPECWTDWVRDSRARVLAEIEALERSTSFDQSPADPYAVVRAVQSALPKDAIIAIDAGTPTPYFAAYYPAPMAGHCVMAARTHGPLGYALPAAVGIQAAEPQRTVAAVFGDGSLGMTLGEMETIARRRAPLLLIYLRNDCYGWIKSLQRLYYSQRYHGVDFDPSVDYAQVAGAHGFSVYHADTASDVSAALRQAQSKGGPAFLEVRIQTPASLIPPVHAWRVDSAVPEDERKRQSY